MTVGSRVRQTRFEGPDQEGLVSLLVAAYHVWREMGQVCERHGITNDQYNVLRILRGVHPDGHPRCEIAERMISRAPDVTRLLDRLERRGLVSRTRSDEDRRYSVTRITPAGLALLERLDPEIRAVQRHLARGLSEAELVELARLCGALLS